MFPKSLKAMDAGYKTAIRKAHCEWEGCAHWAPPPPPFSVASGFTFGPQKGSSESSLNRV